MLIREPDPDRTGVRGLGVADVIFVVVTVAVFGVLGLVAQGVKRL